MGDSELKRTLTLTDLTLFGVASIIGSGGFNFIGRGVSSGGSWWPVAVSIAAVLLMGAAYAYDGAFQRFPNNTAESDILHSVLGPWGEGAGAVAVLVFNLASIVVIIVFCSKLIWPTGSWWIQVATTLGLLTAIAGASLAGIEFDKLIINGTSWILIATLTVAASLALAGFATQELTLPAPTQGGFLQSIFMFFYVLAGFDSIMKFTEEAKEEQDIPRSFYLSNLVSFLLTVGVSTALSYWTPGLPESKQDNAIGWLFAAFTGPWIVKPFKWFMLILLLLATFVTFLATTRYLYGLGDKATWLAPLKEVNSVSAPWISILSVFGIGSIVALLNNIELLVMIADLGFAVIATLVAGAVAVADWRDGSLVPAAVNGATGLGFLGLFGSAFL
jgi:amino acid transporter